MDDNNIIPGGDDGRTDVDRVVTFLTDSVAGGVVDHGLALARPILDRVGLAIPPDMIADIVAALSQVFRDLARKVIELLFGQGKLTIATTGTIHVRVHDGPKPD